MTHTSINTVLAFYSSIADGVYCRRNPLWVVWRNVQKTSVSLYKEYILVVVVCDSMSGARVLPITEPGRTGYDAQSQSGTIGKDRCQSEQCTNIAMRKMSMHTPDPIESLIGSDRVGNVYPHAHQLWCEEFRGLDKQEY